MWCLMKKTLLIIFGLILSFNLNAKSGSSGAGAKSTNGHNSHVHVNGYVRRDGTYVAPHFRTAPDSIKTNNWTYVGNVNPYTGKVGTHTDNSPNYNRGHVVYSTPYYQPNNVYVMGETQPSNTRSPVSYLD